MFLDTLSNSYLLRLRTSVIAKTSHLTPLEGSEGGHLMKVKLSDTKKYHSQGTKAMICIKANAKML